MLILPEGTQSFDLLISLFFFSLPLFRTHEWSDTRWKNTVVIYHVAYKLIIIFHVTLIQYFCFMCVKAKIKGKIKKREDCLEDHVKAQRLRSQMNVVWWKKRIGRYISFAILLWKSILALRLFLHTYALIVLISM
jgi:hypothetical protein